MNTLLKKKLPKYIYTPQYQRAFLTIIPDVSGRWSAGYVVYADILQDAIGGQRCLNYGPYVNDCDDIDQAVIQLFQRYESWMKANKK